MLLGQIAGMSFGIYVISMLPGLQPRLGSFVIPLISALALAAADAEAFFPPDWRQRIVERLASRQLRRSFCLRLGACVGVFLSPVEWLIWHHLIEEDRHGLALTGIGLAMLSVCLSVYAGWYLLTKYPRSQNQT